jgi:hypothetical protein
MGDREVNPEKLLILLMAAQVTSIMFIKTFENNENSELDGKFFKILN